MKREFHFLAANLRYFLGVSAPPAIPPDLDWDRVFDLTERHALAPALYRAIQQARATIPPQAAQRLRAESDAAALLSLRLTAELSRIAANFAAHGIEAVALKGPTLSALLYGNIAVRSYSDLDLLVRKKDLLRAKSLLLGRGFRLTTALHWPADSACFRVRESQLSFSDASNLIHIDVHWRLLPGYFPESLETEFAWKGVRTVSIAGVEARTLSPECLLLYLCAHGAKHGWFRLGWICDLAQLLRVAPGLDWEKIFAESDRTDTSRIVSLGLALVSELFGIELPALPSRREQADTVPRPLARAVIERLSADGGTLAPVVESSLFGVRLFQRGSYRARYLAGLFLAPTEAEHRVLRLPPVLYGLYYPFRPLRLITKYALRLARLGGS